MPASSLSRFLLQAICFLLLLIAPWYFVAGLLATPVIQLAGLFMGMLGWVQGVEQHATQGLLLTTLSVSVEHAGSMRQAYLTPEVDYRLYGYGSALFWALLLASEPQKLMGRFLLGSAVLIPLQAACLCFHWLKVSLIDSGPAVLAQSGWSTGMIEIVALLYQFGYLIVSPLAPVILWFVLQREFAEELWRKMHSPSTFSR